MSTATQFKIGQFYRYTVRDSWCREGIAEVTSRGILDTYWGSNTSESSPLIAAEKATCVLLFDSADYDELDRYCSSSKHRWEQYHPDDRRKTTEQHGFYTRWFVKKGAKPDMATKIANARARLDESQQSLRSAQFSVESRIRELEELERTYAENAPFHLAAVAQRQLPE